MAADASRKDHFRLKDIDDLDLRKLLEELYRDKKYMDRIIDTKEANDQTEEDMCLRLEDGREYLLGRARFWQEKGPLPPRPPTTDLGLRLQRERTMQSRMATDQDRESRQDGALSRARTDMSRRGVRMPESRQTAAQVSRQDDRRPSERDVSTDQPSQKSSQEGQMTEQGQTVPRHDGQLQPKRGQASDHEGQLLDPDEGLSGQNGADHAQNASVPSSAHGASDFTNQDQNQEENPTKPFSSTDIAGEPSHENRQQRPGEYREPEGQAQQQEQHPREEERHQAQPQLDAQVLQQGQQASHQHYQPQQQQYEEAQQRDEAKESQRERSPSSTSGKSHHEIPNGNIAPLRD